MSYQDDNAQKPEDIPTEPCLGYMDRPGNWAIFPRGTNFCVFIDPDPTTPKGKTPLVLKGVEDRKFIFMCGCNKCLNATPEDKKNGRVRYAVYSLKWHGAHAHGG